MKRVLCLALICLSAGCVAPGERTPLKMLPDDSPPLPYAELLTRARAQANAAIDASYVDNWTELEDAARGLEQTAKFLPRSVELPAKQKDVVPVVAGDLGKEAGTLREAAKAKDVEKTTASLTRIQQTVRKLRLD
ncbi:MAG TPA: hypothetical protein VFW33_20765 [Gemmataceae bacterium]|nr:hypothetical protein [Gemmataceae bacterium]